VRATSHPRSHPSRHHRARFDTSDQIIFGAAATLFGSGTLLWLTGELAGRLFGDGSPGADPTELVGIVLPLVSDPGDPAAAWPGEARNVLPGPVLFYVCLLCLLGLGFALALGLRRLWHSPDDAGERVR
jgi:hypothetical protein